MLSTLFVLMSLGVAQADEGSCKSCCQAAGITPCATKIRVVGDDSLIVARSTGYEAIGLFVSEWSASQRARLEKRSTDYDNKGPGKAARDEQIAKLKEKGTIPKGWGA